LNEPPPALKLEEVWDKLAEHHLKSRPPAVAGRGAETDGISEERERAAGAAIADSLFRDL
jgi:hypothetical protein